LQDLTCQAPRFLYIRVFFFPLISVVWLNRHTVFTPCSLCFSIKSSKKRKCVYLRSLVLFSISNCLEQGPHSFLSIFRRDPSMCIALLD
jgi:hypothetical protein